MAHDVAAALILVPASLVAFILTASRVRLAYSHRTAGQQFIGLDAAEAIDPRAGLGMEVFFSASALLMLVLIVVDNLGRPDGTVALLPGAGGLEVAAIWIAAMPRMTVPEPPAWRQIHGATVPQTLGR